MNHNFLGNGFGCLGGFSASTRDDPLNHKTDQSGHNNQDPAGAEGGDEASPCRPQSMNTGIDYSDDAIRQADPHGTSNHLETRQELGRGHQPSAINHGEDNPSRDKAESATKRINDEDSEEHPESPAFGGRAPTQPEGNDQIEGKDARPGH